MQHKFIYSRLQLYLTHYKIPIISKTQILKFINKILPSIIDNTILRIIITINITIITTNHQTYKHHKLIQLIIININNINVNKNNISTTTTICYYLI